MKLISSLILAVMLVVACAGQGHHKTRLSSGEKLAHLAALLNLTDAQKQQIKPILDEEEKAVAQFDYPHWPSQSENVQRKKAHEDTIAKIRAILTADQIQTLKDLHCRPEAHTDTH